MITNRYKILETYKGCQICCVNYREYNSKWIGVMINGELSVVALATVQGAKNVIDTHLKTKLC